MTVLYFLLVTVNLLLVAWQAYQDVNRRSPLVFFWIGICAIFIVPSYLDIFVVNVSAHPHAVAFTLRTTAVVKAQLVCCAFLLVYVALDMALMPRRFSLPGFEVKKNNKNLFCLLFLVFFLSLIVIPFIEVLSKYGIDFTKSFGFQDRRLGISFISAFILGYGLKISAALGVIFLILRKKLFFLCVVFLFLGVFLLLGGSRQPIIYLATPVIALLVFRARRPFLTLVLTFVVLYVCSGVFELLIYFRNLGGAQERLQALINFGHTINTAFLRPDPASVRFAFYYFIEKGGGLPGLFDFAYMRRLALFWLPSPVDVLSIKPLDFEYTMFRYYMKGRQGSLQPTFFGSIYADSGAFFILWAFVFYSMNIIVLKILSKLSGVLYLVGWTVAAGGAIMWARGAIYGPSVVMYVAFMLCAFLSLLYILIPKNSKMNPIA